jgi:tetratricopeptide (TPR) repeat protein
MYNLLISLAVAGLAFGVGAAMGQWVYGFAPAMLVLPVVYFLLARRTGQQLEAIMTRAGVELQAGRLKQARDIIETGYALGKWQFLIEQQIHAQLGALEFMQRRYKQARPLLEKAWKRNWQAQGMLAILDARSGKHDEAFARLDKAALLAKREPMYWGLTCWLLLDAKRVDDAQRKVVEGLETVENSKALKELQTAIANDKMKRFRWDRAFGQGWYQFFPEQAQAGQTRGGPAANDPRMRGRKTFPQPRR